MVDVPTLLLQNRNFDTIDIISDVFNLTYKENLNSPNELSFMIYKYLNNKKNRVWDFVTDSKIIYIPEFKEKFEIKTSVKENDSTQKYVSAVSLCESELSGIRLYNIEINTKDDILNINYDEKFPTVFYRNIENFMDYDWSNSKYANYSDEDKKNVIRNSSLLHRLLEKAPHYSIKHVDSFLMNIQRSFSISDTDIYSELINEISEEFNCLFLFDSMTREIYVYDLYNTCKKCGYRGDFSNICPECGSNEFDGQYGNDTSVFISTENLATEINLETNKDSLKNCFYIEGGDDIMTSAIRSINPNGSSYIYTITDYMKSDMPDTLSSALDSYQKLYLEYSTIHSYALNKDLVDQYNFVVDYVNNRFEDVKYSLLPKYSIVGYPETTTALYEAIDLYEFVKTSMLPTIQTSGIGIEESLQAIISGFENGFSNDTNVFTNEIALENYKTAIISTVERAIINNAKIFYSPAYYDLKVETQTYIKATDSENGLWEGYFTIISLTEKDDNGNKISKTSKLISLSISNRTELFIEQKIYRAISNKDKISRYDISNIKLDEQTFKTQLGLYSLDELQNLSDSFQGCLDIILTIDIDDTLPNEKIINKYADFYSKRKSLIDDEIVVRNQMLECIKNIYYYDSKKNEYSGELYEIRKNTNNILNFEKYIKNYPDGINLWKTFCAYRKEDKYINSNYISDGMTNSEIIKQAKKLLDVANKELYKASHPQYTLTATMNNLLVLEAFHPLVKSFSVGNWIRLNINDEIFKLRLLSYQINFDEIQSIDVEFSTIENVWSGITDIKSIIDSASSIVQSYSGIIQQMDKTKNTTDCVQSWIDDGFKATQTKFVDSDKQDIVIDNHGILARSYDDITDSYSPYQLKFLSNGLYLTPDNWKTISTGIGRISYIDPETKEQIDDYGIIAKTVYGKLILSEKLGIYNSNGSLKFTEDGFFISNNKSDSEKNTFSVNPNNNNNMLKITKGEGLFAEDVLYTDNQGNLHMVGTMDINGGYFRGDITAEGTITGGEIIGAEIKGGSINIGENNFFVDENGNMSAKNCKLHGNTGTDTLAASTDIFIGTRSLLSSIKKIEEDSIKFGGNHEIFNQKITALETEAASLDNKVFALQGEVGNLNENLNEQSALIGNNFVSFTNSISALNSQLATINNEITNIKTRLNNLENKIK